MLLLANSLCVFLPNQFLFPTPQSHPRRTTFEFSATLTFSRLGACAFPRLPQGAATPTLPQLNLHNTRVRRNPERLPSSRCIESAHSRRARVRILPIRASDTALRLLRTWYFDAVHRD